MFQKMEQCQEMGNCIIGFGYIPLSFPLINTLLYISMEFSLLMDTAFQKALIEITTKHLHLWKQGYDFHVSLFSA